jgi:hypothetical protein
MYQFVLLCARWIVSGKILWGPTSSEDSVELLLILYLRKRWGACQDRVKYRWGVESEMIQMLLVSYCAVGPSLIPLEFRFEIT